MPEDIQRLMPSHYMICLSRQARVHLPINRDAPRVMPDLDLCGLRCRLRRSVRPPRTRRLIAAVRMVRVCVHCTCGFFALFLTAVDRD